jgi:hypothetical protein
MAVAKLDDDWWTAARAGGSVARGDDLLEEP